MNYLILTPDGVGSTLLQRIITMCLYLENHEVTNTHELTNGLYLHNGIVKKNFDLKYSQSLQEIQKILTDTANHTDIVSRLAKYHINGRTDTKLEQNKFYSFLNKYFDKIIMCVRNNVFEYAMSWSIRKESDVLNVYNKADKEKVLKVSKVDELFFIEKCKDYVNYQYWVEDNFPNVVQISYEDMLLQSDKIIKLLTGYDDTFKKSFGVPLTEIMQKEYDFFKSFTTDQKQDLTKEEAKALAKYRFTSKEMIEKDIIFNVPLKNTTLSDKRSQIQNFDSCLNKFYDFAKNHNWIDQSTATYDFWRKDHVC